ncbi:MULTISPECIES: tetratricopeptide repeat protein [Stenotrophomonas]|uniref:tetratricopeptide repeat protein n=1 Tax=Stenotrophomonas TaxID=40323 RepID=UPI0026E582D2|nr:tetratricopeptide repeat protein [Stenotrophomonas sp. 704A1]
MKPMTVRTLIQPLALSGLCLALAACVSSAPPVATPVDTTTPAQRLAAVEAAAGPDDKELSVQPLRDSQVEDLRQTAVRQRQAHDLAGAASSLDQALQIVAGDPSVLQERAELSLLQGRWAEAETFARKAVDLGSKTGPLCRRHWATIEQARLARGEKENAVSAHAQIEGCTVPGIKRY